MSPLRLILILCFTSLLFPSVSGIAGKIYKWVDERGIVHFSDQEPDSDKVKGKVEERDLTDKSSRQESANATFSEKTKNPIEYVANCTFSIKAPNKIGSGFLISPNGYAVTCRHVVEDSPNLVAVMNDQQEAQLNVLLISTKYDLALVQVMVAGKTPHLTIRDAEKLAPGDRLFAVGASAGLQSTITDGVFTGFRNIESVKGTYIQFSAPLNPGNSGGPLVDENGMVVGVVSLKFLSKQGVPVSGVGFAVPSAQIKEEYGTYIEK
jgi:S1-C subfamily serine protease